MADQKSNNEKSREEEKSRLKSYQKSLRKNISKVKPPKTGAGQSAASPEFSGPRGAQTPKGTAAFSEFAKRNLPGQPKLAGKTPGPGPKATETQPAGRFGAVTRRTGAGAPPTGIGEGARKQLKEQMRGPQVPEAVRQARADQAAQKGADYAQAFKQPEAERPEESEQIGPAPAPRPEAREAGLRRPGEERPQAAPGLASSTEPEALEEAKRKRELERKKAEARKEKKAEPGRRRRGQPVAGRRAAGRAGQALGIGRGRAQRPKTEAEEVEALLKRFAKWFARAAATILGAACCNPCCWWLVIIVAIVVVIYVFLKDALGL